MVGQIGSHIYIYIYIYIYIFRYQYSVYISIDMYVVNTPLSLPHTDTQQLPDED
jgi:hypothetical protein